MRLASIVFFVCQPIEYVNLYTFMWSVHSKINVYDKYDDRDFDSYCTERHGSKWWMFVWRLSSILRQAFHIECAKRTTAKNNSVRMQKVRASFNCQMSTLCIRGLENRFDFYNNWMLWAFDNCLIYIYTSSEKFRRLMILMCILFRRQSMPLL